MSLCKLCKCPGCALRGSEYDFASCPSYEPMNRADRLRAMSDEKLAWAYAYRLASCYGCEASTMEECAKCTMEWLGQEAQS